MIVFFLSRLARPVLIILALLAALGILGVFGASKISGAIEAARESAFAERDAFWRAEIAASNARAEQERAAQSLAAHSVEARARETIDQLNAALADMERKNAALPNASDCGLNRERLRLLK